MKKRSLEIEKQENFLTDLWSNDQNLSSNHFYVFFQEGAFCDEYHNNSFRKGLHQRFFIVTFLKTLNKKLPKFRL